MTESQHTAKEQIYRLVNSQKKVKLEWISTVTKISVERIIAYADELGLIIDGEYIVYPKKDETFPVAIREVESHPVVIREVKSYKQSVIIVKENKTKKILLIILAIFMILIPFPGFFYGGVFGLLGIVYGAVGAAIGGFSLIIASLASFIFGIRLLNKQLNK